MRSDNPAVSAHFHRREFACHHCGLVRGPSAELLAMLEHLRTRRGAPIRVVSGTRCVYWNRHVGGAPDSRHLHGDAADIEHGWCTLSMALDAGATGIGLKNGYVVHVDTRPARAPVIFHE